MGNRLALLPEGSGVEEARSSDHKPNRHSSKEPLRTSESQPAYSSWTPKHLSLPQEFTTQPALLLNLELLKVLNKGRLRMMASMGKHSAVGPRVESER